MSNTNTSKNTFFWKFIFFIGVNNQLFLSLLVILFSFLLTFSLNVAYAVEGLGDLEPEKKIVSNIASGFYLFNQRVNQITAQYEHPHLLYKADTLPKNHILMPTEFLAPSETAYTLNPKSTSHLNEEEVKTQFNLYNYKGIVFAQCKETEKDILNWHYFFCKYGDVYSESLEPAEAAIVDNNLGNLKNGKFVSINNLDKNRDAFSTSLGDTIELNESLEIQANYEWKYKFNMLVDKIQRSTFRAYPGVNLTAYSKPSNAFVNFTYQGERLVHFPKVQYATTMPLTVNQKCVLESSDLILKSIKLHPKVGMDSVINIMKNCIKK